MNLTAKETKVKLEEMFDNCMESTWYHIAYDLYQKNRHVIYTMYNFPSRDYDRTATGSIDSVLNEYEFNYEYIPQA